MDLSHEHSVEQEQSEKDFGNPMEEPEGQKQGKREQRIFRTPAPTTSPDWVRLPRATAEDKHISFDQLGFLSTGLSCFNQQEFDLKEIVEEVGKDIRSIGRTRYNKFVGKLIAVGYLELKHVRRIGGRMDGWQYRISDYPGGLENSAELIVRTPKLGRGNPYVAIPSQTIRDTRLSYEALGLLIYLLSKPDDWELNRLQLRRERGNGRHTIDGMIGELIDAGYIQRLPQVPRIGKHPKWYYLIYDYSIHAQSTAPRDDHVSAEKPSAGKTSNVVIKDTSNVLRYQSKTKHLRQT